MQYDLFANKKRIGNRQKLNRNDASCGSLQFEGILDLAVDIVAEVKINRMAVRNMGLVLCLTLYEITDKSHYSGTGGANNTIKKRWLFCG